MDVVPCLAAFAKNIYGNIVAQSLNDLKNTFFSPFNIYTALGMVLCGGENNTKAELMKAMQLPESLEHSKIHNGIREMLANCSKADQGVEIILGNRIFTTPSANVRNEFKENVEKYYKAETECVLFEKDIENARTLINQWVSKQTKGKVQELLSPGSLTENTSVVVVATTYFKGAWKLAFPEINTHDSEFHKLDGSKMEVKLMFKESFFDMVELPHLKSRAIKIPFKDPMFTLLVVLPDANDGLLSLIKSLYADNGLSYILSSNDFDTKKLQLFLPRFKLREGSAMSLKEILKNMGINDAFCSSKANFSSISNSHKLYISDVLHKAILEVSPVHEYSHLSTFIMWNSLFNVLLLYY
ncbi:unnamed protein product [Heterobilharzia americana]|nr:unnamed protein product [Heterobilharzia americana]